MRWNDIDQLIPHGNYRTDIPLIDIEHTLERWSADNHCGLILEPDFQRAHVWTDAQRTAWVEYILRGGKKSRDLLFNCSTWQSSFSTPIVLVDGLQRLTAMRKFLANELPVFGGAYLRDFDGTIPWTICLEFYVNNLPTRADVLRWYIQLNAGGTPHSEAEIERVRALLESEQT